MVVVRIDREGLALQKYKPHNHRMTETTSPSRRIEILSQNRKKKHMSRSFPLIAIAVAFFASSAFGQTGLYLLDAPTDGAVRPTASNNAIVYVGTMSSVDHFTVATEDADGVSFIDVTIDNGEVSISNVDFGGPLAMRTSSLALTESDPTRPPPLEGAIEDDPYIIIIYVDQPGDGGDRDVSEGGILTDADVGHTFIEVINGETGETTTVGLYPDDPVGPWTTEVDGSSSQ